MKAQLSVKTAEIHTVTAFTAGSSIILGLCHCWLPATHPDCFTQDQLNITVCGFQFLFACFWQQKSLLPLFDIELRFLAVPACNSVTALRLPQLDSSNGRTDSIFQILLIAQASSGWRQQQLLTGCFVRGFEFGASNTSRKLATEMFDFLFLFYS